MRRVRRRGRIAPAALVAILVLISLPVIVAIVFAATAGEDTPPEPVVPQSARVTGDVPEVGAWRPDQVANAAIIVQAGEDLGFGERDRAIAVMTAMGESSLRILDRGDEAGPDSRGLFQQRDSWGSYEVRMDAYASAVLFFNALGELPDRDALSPTRVAHAVQINRDPRHYARYWEDALAVTSALADADITVVRR